LAANPEIGQSMSASAFIVTFIVTYVVKLPII